MQNKGSYFMNYNCLIDSNNKKIINIPAGDCFIDTTKS